MTKHADAFAELLTLAVGGTPDGMTDEDFGVFSDSTIEWMMRYQVEDHAPDESDIPDSAFVWLDELTGMAYCYESDTHIIAVTEGKNTGYVCVPTRVLQNYLRNLAITPIARYMTCMRPIIRKKKRAS